MATFFRGIRMVLNKYPVTRGMATYAILWPASNFVHQNMDKSLEKFNYVESFRFFTLGSLITAPTVYVWVKTVSKIVKGTKFRHAV